jgi:hypothetical protein
LSGTEVARFLAVNSKVIRNIDRLSYIGLILPSEQIVSKKACMCRVFGFAVLEHRYAHTILWAVAKRAGPVVHADRR